MLKSEKKNVEKIIKQEIETMSKETVSDECFFFESFFFAHMCAGSSTREHDEWETNYTNVIKYMRRDFNFFFSSCFHSSCTGGEPVLAHTKWLERENEFEIMREIRHAAAQVDVRGDDRDDDVRREDKRKGTRNGE